MRIGVVTSSAGAAVHDIIRVLRKRWPVGKILLLPVRVQGVEAPPEIVGAIKYANKYNVADVLIVGRGGGSIEDLWAFNDERVARAIYDSEIPIISAVGHEPDVTIADFVADLRAATPSNGAELCAPDQSELMEYLDSAQVRNTKAITRKLDMLRQRLKSYAEKRVMQDPKNYVADRQIALGHLEARLNGAMTNALTRKNARFSADAAKLDALSPLKVLGRGYAIARDKNGNVIKASSEVKSGDEITVRLKEDEINCIVK
jgi:exodeoxyribonuclease VII large subunit